VAFAAAAFAIACRTRSTDCSGLPGNLMFASAILTIAIRDDEVEVPAA
jgi:hypothetical protein